MISVSLVVFAASPDETVGWAQRLSPPYSDRRFMKSLLRLLCFRGVTLAVFTKR